MDSAQIADGSTDEGTRTDARSDDHGPAVVEACCEACAAVGHSASGCSSGACAPKTSSGLYDAGSSGIAYDGVVFSPARTEPMPIMSSVGEDGGMAGDREESIDSFNPARFADSDARVDADGYNAELGPVFDAAMLAQLEESKEAARELAAVGSTGTVYGDPNEGDAGKGSGDRIGAEDARRWVDSGIDIIGRTIDSRLAEGDRASNREYLERMAAQDFQNNRDEREFRLKLAEIEARYRGTPTSIPDINLELQRQQAAQSNTGMIAIGAAVLVGGAFLFMKR